MRRWWCPGVVVLALLVAACVPEPAFRQSRSPGSSTDEAAATSEPTPGGPTPTPSFVRPTPTPGPSFTIYKVKKGDTLTKIAKKFKTSGQSIAYWNRVTYPTLDPESAKYRPDRLEVGWLLQLLPNQEVDPEALPTLTPAPGETPEPVETPEPTT
jgi:hypothetical protein